MDNMSQNCPPRQIRALALNRYQAPGSPAVLVVRAVAKSNKDAASAVAARAAGISTPSLMAWSTVIAGTLCACRRQAFR
jgi:hypothetical protein